MRRNRQGVSAAGWLVRFASLLSAAMLVGGTAAPALSGERLHVSMSGSDVNEGTADAPLRTIQSAADLAQPGTTGDGARRGSTSSRSTAISTAPSTHPFASSRTGKRQR